VAVRNLDINLYKRYIVYHALFYITSNKMLCLLHQTQGQADWHADTYAKDSGLIASAQQALCAHCYSH